MVTVNSSRAVLIVAVLTVVAAANSRAQDAAGVLSVKSIAEVESKAAQGGRGAGTLRPANRVAPGDEVIYTLEVRNTGVAVASDPVVIHAIPEHMRYVAASAVGPGAEVSYSVDGGLSFDPWPDLRAVGADGRTRPAAAADITHIRWQLKHPLQPNSVAFVRFRAVVK